MKHATAAFLALLLPFGMASITGAEPPKSQQQETISRITCKPGFDLQVRNEIDVVDGKGNHRDAFHQWLILDDGKQRFRIRWGSPPLSRGPVELSSQQVYTFHVSTRVESGQTVHSVSRILKDGKVIHEASDKKDPSNKSERSNH